MISVNLPRWGLKHASSALAPLRILCVNLPRWGLKLTLIRDLETYLDLCKFTPLGFETAGAKAVYALAKSCKFTPLGFETI